MPPKWKSIAGAVLLTYAAVKWALDDDEGALSAQLPHQDRETVPYQTPEDKSSYQDLKSSGQPQATGILQQRKELRAAHRTQAFSPVSTIPIITPACYPLKPLFTQLKHASAQATLIDRWKRVECSIVLGIPTSTSTSPYAGTTLRGKV